MVPSYTTDSPTDPWSPRTGEAIDLVALGESAETIRCAAAGRSERLLVRPGLSAVRPVPGELFTVEVGRRWRLGRAWIVQGNPLDPRLDSAALGLEPLKLRLVSQRPREWELERIAGSHHGPLDEVEQLWEAGELDVALHLAGDLLARDLRCLDAHALLGRFFLDGPLELRWSERALRHFRVGKAIGGLSLGSDFDGWLPWRLPGNRGYLRCLAGEGRALERLGEAGEAARAGDLLARLAPDAPDST